MKVDKIYISGKITGLHKYVCKRNFEKAIKLAQEWADKENELTVSNGILKYKCVLNYTIINPLNIKPFLGLKNWLCYMINDIRELRKCNVIAMQPNWMYSKGAVIEYFIAKFILKIKVIFL